MVCFTQTRTKTQDIFIIDNHIDLIYSNEDAAASPASGVAILVHRRWTTSIERKVGLRDRIMAVHFKVGQKHLTIIAVYLPHARYNWK